MYSTHFGFSAKPFQLKADPLVFHNNSHYETAYRALLNGIRQRQGLLVLTGPAGVGKSALLRILMSGAADFARFSVFTKTTLGFSDVLDHLATALGLPLDAGDADKKFQTLQQFLSQMTQGDIAFALIIDDAHNLDHDTLNKLLRFRNGTRFQPLPMLLVGLPSLLEKLNPALIDTGCALTALDPAEIQPFVIRQIEQAGGSAALFPAETLARINDYAQGIPRTITALCDHALFIASLENSAAVAPDMIDEAAQQLFLVDAIPIRNNRCIVPEITPADAAQALETPPHVPQVATPAPQQPAVATPVATTSLPVPLPNPKPAPEPPIVPERSYTPRPLHARRPPRRRHSAITLIFLLGLGLSAVGAVAWYRPAWLGLERTQVAAIIDRAETLVYQGAAYLGEQLTHLRHAITGPENPENLGNAENLESPPPSPAPAPAPARSTTAPLPLPAQPYSPRANTPPTTLAPASPTATAHVLIPEPEPEPEPESEPAPPSALTTTPTNTTPPAPVPMRSAAIGLAEPTLATLLARAESQLAAQHLTTPADDNALETYLQILAQDPNNAQALAGVQRIKSLYREWAEQAVQNKRWTLARQYYERALTFDPHDPALQAALQNLPD